MRWIGLLIAICIFTGVTAGAYVASAQGWGLPGTLDEPVSVRQESATGPHRHGPTFLYFGSSRRHSAGGFRGGK